MTKKFTKTPNKLIKRPVKTGEILEGEVIGRGRSRVYVDLGPQGTGIVYGKEFYRARAQLRDISDGETIPVKIKNQENEDGYIEVSLKDASDELSWGELEEKEKEDETITIKIKGANKGGLLTTVAGIQAFLPVSQLAPEHYPKVEGGNKQKILEKLKKFIGKEMEVKIATANPKQDKLILSEKATESSKMKEILEENYEVGEVIEGEITSIVDFGAFIKFSKEEDDIQEPIEGLIHISELDWKLIDNPSEVVKSGEKIEAEIIDISGDKVSLSLKALKENPWDNIKEKLEKGAKVEGEVTKLTSFGAFIQITPKIQGLVHISEFGSKDTMEKELQPGNKYTFEILNINPDKYQISLKLVS